MTFDEIEAERPYLFGLAYRMLGSAADAEDVLQEAFLRAHDLQDVRSPRAMLTTIVTRLCLDELRSAHRRREQYVGPWLPEPIATEAPGAAPVPRADEATLAAESVSMAFLVLLEALSPLERAVFVLRDVLDLDFAEIAEATGRSEAAVRQLLHRARGHVAAGKARFPAAPEAQRSLTAAFFEALSHGDLDGLTKMLTADVFAEADHGGKAKANLRTVVGADRVARFLAGLYTKLATPEARSLPLWLNGSLGIVVIERDVLTTAMIFEMTRDDAGEARIAALRTIRNPDKLVRLQREIEAGRIVPAGEWQAASA
jgi:RNA polymerase sigma-70 factor, ECF subfamily